MILPDIFSNFAPCVGDMSSPGVSGNHRKVFVLTVFFWSETTKQDRIAQIAGARKCPCLWSFCTSISEWSKHMFDINYIYILSLFAGWWKTKIRTFNTTALTSFWSPPKKQKNWLKPTALKSFDCVSDGTGTNKIWHAEEHDPNIQLWYAFSQILSLPFIW